MSDDVWVIKCGDPSEEDEFEVEYLQHWEVGPYLDKKNIVWGPEQWLAFRFKDRNHASRICREMRSYSEDVRLVKLVPRGTLRKNHGS